MKKLLAKLFVVALLWCGLSGPASAALALTHKGNNSGATTSVSVASLTVSAGDLIVVGGAVRLAANGDTVAISDGAGDTFTYYEFQTGAGTRAYVAFTKTTGLSSQSVTITTSGSAPLMMSLSVEDVTGFDTTTIEDTAVLAHSSAVSATPNVTSGTPTYTGDLFYSSFQYGNTTYTEDATWTNTANNQGNTNAKGTTGYFISSGSATVTRSGSTAGSSNWKGIILGIKAAAAAGSGTSSGLTLMGITN